MEICRVELIYPALELGLRAEIVKSAYIAVESRIREAEVFLVRLSAETGNGYLVHKVIRHTYRVTDLKHLSHREV